MNASSPYAKPLPEPDPATRPYWDSLRAHALQVQRCAACGRSVFYPRAVCPHCFGGPLEWRRVSGRGALYSFTVVHRAPTPAFRLDVPYVVALVDLDEGVRLMGTLVDVAPIPEHIHIGMPVAAVYDDVTPEVTLLRFRPA